MGIDKRKVSNKDFISALLALLLSAAVVSLCVMQFLKDVTKH